MISECIQEHYNVHKNLLHKKTLAIQDFKINWAQSQLTMCIYYPDGMSGDRQKHKIAMKEIKIAKLIKRQLRLQLRHNAWFKKTPCFDPQDLSHLFLEGPCVTCKKVTHVMRSVCKYKTCIQLLCHECLYLYCCPVHVGLHLGRRPWIAESESEIEDCASGRSTPEFERMALKYHDEYPN